MLDTWNAGLKSWDDIAAEFGFDTGSAAMMAVRRFVKRTGLEMRYGNEKPISEDIKVKAYQDRIEGKTWKEIAETYDYPSAAAARRQISRWACGRKGWPAPIPARQP